MPTAANVIVGLLTCNLQVNYVTHVHGHIKAVAYNNLILNLNLLTSVQVHRCQYQLIKGIKYEDVNWKCAR